MSHFNGSSDNKMGRVSLYNTFNGTLGAGLSYTGSGEQVSEYAQLTVFVDADQISATKGLKLQVSTDGSDWSRSKDITITGFSVHTLVITSKFFRINYTNGTTEVNLKLQVIYHKSKSKHLTSTTSQVINDETDVEVIRQANVPLLDIARNIVSNKQVIHKFGHSEQGVNSTESTVWNGGSNYEWLQAAETIQVRSGGNINDASSGTGARTICIHGLDENWESITDIITLDGDASSESTTNTYLRVNRCFVDTSGTYHGTNEAEIVLETSSTNTKLASIQVEKGQSQLGFYTVPLNSSAYLKRIEVNLDALSNKTANVFLYQYDNTQTGAPKRLVWRLDDMSQQHDTVFESYIEFTQKTDIEFRATATATSSMSVNMDLIVINNE